MDENRVTGAAKELGGKMQTKVGDALGDRSTQAEGMADQLEGKAEAVAGRAKDAVRATADTVKRSAESRFREAEGTGQDLYGKAKGVARDVADDAGDHLSDGRRAARQGVDEHPLAALLIAGLAGYVAAILVHGRR